MNINGMPIPDGFLEEEVRNDYTVSAGMKKVWAVQIELLEELKRVCEKYHLTYYADSGTLIGAIRHKGYIPWDDDIDIVMMREDYRKLQEVAEKEFLYPVFLQSTYSENAFFKGYSRLMNLDTRAVSGHDAEKGFSHGVCIDIFPLDRIPDNEKEFAKWKKQIRRMYSALYAYAYSGGGMQGRTNAGGYIKHGAILAYRSVIDRYGYMKLFRKYEELCCRYNNTETERVSYIAYSRGKAKHLWRRCLFDASHEVPFEFTTINIPDGYDERLRVEYGDYMVMKRAGTAHGEMVEMNADGAFRGSRGVTSGGQGVTSESQGMTSGGQGELSPVAPESQGEASQAAPEGQRELSPVALESSQVALKVMEKPDWISYEEITDVLHDAHMSTAEKGMHFVALNQTAEETEKRLGEDGKFFVVLASDGSRGESSPSAPEGQEAPSPSASEGRGEPSPLDPNETAQPGNQYILAGVGAISFYKSCKGWYGKGQPYADIKMVGVRNEYKGQGISSMLYKALEEYGFSQVNLITMNTAEMNAIVLGSNARHGWKRVDFRSWTKTDYYSVVMAKWKDACPFSDAVIKRQYELRKAKTRFLRNAQGKRRLIL